MKRPAEADAGGKRQRRQRKLDNGAETAPAPPSAEPGTACRLRWPGEEQWQRATLLAFRGADKRTVELQPDASGDDAVAKSYRAHLDEQPVYVAREVAWVPPADPTTESNDGFVPMVLFEPIGPAEDEEGLGGKRLANTLHDGAHIFVERDCPLRPLAGHMWKRRTKPGFKEAVQAALEQARALQAPKLKLARASIVGRRLCVYWPMDDAWYGGTISNYEPKEGKHEVHYDDNVDEWLDLAHEMVHVFSDEAEEATFDGFSRVGDCYMCGRSGRLVQPAEEAAPAALGPVCAPVEAAPAAEGDGVASDAHVDAAADSSDDDVACEGGSGEEAETGAEAAAPDAPEPSPRAPSPAGDVRLHSGEMLQCAGCRDRFHFECLDKPLEKRPKVWDTWRCLSCKLCKVCGDDGSKVRLAICDDCDVGYHIGCLDPPLKSFPLKGFKCPGCVKCSSCGTTTAKAWNSDYTMCQPCGRLFRSKKCARTFLIRQVWPALPLEEVRAHLPNEASVAV